MDQAVHGIVCGKVVVVPLGWQQQQQLGELHAGSHTGCECTGITAVVNEENRAASRHAVGKWNTNGVRPAAARVHCTSQPFNACTICSLCQKNGTTHCP